MTVSREKKCAYSGCGREFTDDSRKNSMTFCQEECRRRAKVERSGKTPLHGYLTDRTNVCQNPACAATYQPTSAQQRFCSIACRAVVYTGGDDARTKTCGHCGQPFIDLSKNNNKQYHPECARKRSGVKPDPTRAVGLSETLDGARDARVRLGDGGRIDSLESMRKYTQTWWGRVAELIYSAYRPLAEDMNRLHGSRAAYDFEDVEFGRVDVRSTQERQSPQGRPMWSFQVAGLKESCDHVFMVGFGSDGERVTRLWLVPVSDLNDALMRMAPGSSQYVGDKWDVTTSWGVMMGEAVLKRARSLPEPTRPARRFDWVADPTKFDGRSAAHRGRRGEFLYQQLYPDSKDMNVAEGVHAPFDFLDSDGTKVNVKTARLLSAKDRPSLVKWSFLTLSTAQLLRGHKCDVYVLLCLDAEGTTVQREYRVPCAVFGERTQIHIALGREDQWSSYRVR